MIYNNPIAQEIYEEFGQLPTWSKTSYGQSFYIWYRGYQVRFSDHMTGAHRMNTEIQFEYGYIDKEAADIEIDLRNAMKDPANYKEETKTFINLNTEYGVKKFVGKKPATFKVIEERGMSKGRFPAPLYLFEVTVVNKVFVNPFQK